MEKDIGPVDRLIALCEQGLRTCAGVGVANRSSPGDDVEDRPLSADARRESIALMRVNHAGEVAAQALYSGQALLARSSATRDHLLRAAQEERDHLVWCEARLRELGGRTSYLVPFWFAGSALIGIAASLAGDDYSFGFVRETEKQVEAHLADHIDRLPDNDARSRAILERMSEDEARHGRDADAAGATDLPAPIRTLMSFGGSLVRQVARNL